MVYDKIKSLILIVSIKIINSLNNFFYKIILKIAKDKKKYISTREMFIRKEISKLEEIIEKLNFNHGLYFNKKAHLEINKNLYEINDLGRRLFRSGFLKEDDYHFQLDKLFEEIKLNGNMIIDIGASIGEFSIFFSKKNDESKILSVEASKSIFSVLCRNISLNKISNIMTLNKVVCEESRLKFKILDKGDQSYPERIYANDQEKEFIESISLDDLIKDYNIDKIDLLKIDIEQSNNLLIEDVIKNCDKINFIFYECSKSNPDRFIKLIDGLKDKFEFSIYNNNEFININLINLKDKINNEVNLTSGFDILFFKK